MGAVTDEERESFVRDWANLARRMHELTRTLAKRQAALVAEEERLSRLETAPRERAGWFQPAASVAIALAVVASVGTAPTPSIQPHGKPRVGVEELRAPSHDQRRVGSGPRTHDVVLSAAEAPSQPVTLTDAPSEPIAHEFGDQPVDEVDELGNAPEPTAIKILDMKIKTPESGAPVCIEGSPVAPEPAVCRSSKPKKK